MERDRCALAALSVTLAPCAQGHLKGAARSHDLYEDAPE
jgi:hypothetical protein